MLSVSHVRKAFGSVQAVCDVSFSLGRGSAFGLLGPNGAGKTTVMRMILRILESDGGGITWDGVPVSRRTARTFGYLPEERGLYGKMKARDQIIFFARLHGIAGREAQRRTDRWIERLDLREAAQRACAELSKGNQQKVQVACAAVHEPGLLILDEPFSGLDPVNAEMLSAILQELQAKGTAMLLSSHQMWQLEHLCRSFCIISNGSNRAAGTLAELRAAWPTRIIKIEPGSEAVRLVMHTVPQGRFLPPEEGAAYYEIPAQTPLPELLKRLVNADAITRFESVEPSLHEIYLDAIGKGNTD